MHIADIAQCVVIRIFRHLLTNVILLDSTHIRFTVKYAILNSLSFTDLVHFKTVFFISLVALIHINKQSPVCIQILSKTTQIPGAQQAFYFVLVGACHHIECCLIIVHRIS